MPKTKLGADQGRHRGHSRGIAEKIDGAEYGGTSLKPERLSGRQFTDY